MVAQQTVVRDPCANETKNALIRRHRAAREIVSEQDFFSDLLITESA
jgi:hypothetical protein